MCFAFVTSIARVLHRTRLYRTRFSSHAFCIARVLHRTRFASHAFCIARFLHRMLFETFGFHKGLLKNVQVRKTCLVTL